MENHEEINKEEVSVLTVDETGLSDEELDETSGGIIVIGGMPGMDWQAKINQVTLNPQPLPPRILENQGGY
jgi:hypothetical protein